MNKIKENPNYNFNPGLSLIDLRITGPQSGPGFRKADLSAYPGLNLKSKIVLPYLPNKRHPRKSAAFERKKKVNKRRGPDIIEV